MISKLGILTIAWVAILLFGLALLPIYNQVEFDPNNRLLMSSMNMDFDNAFSQEMTNSVGRLRRSVVHFTSQDCVCDSFASRHQNTFKDLLSDQKYSYHIVTVVEGAPLALMLPATPAVAIFDDQGKLSYLGPYAAGMGCYAGPGFVEQIVSYVLSEPAGAWVNSDNQGCYCHL